MVMASPEGTELQTFPDGTSKHEINWHNGKKDGWEIKWHSNGQMLSKRKWVDGNPKPPGLVWDENGDRVIIKPDLDRDLCLFCGACVGVCPTNAMFLEYNDRDIWVDENCTDCLLCTRICPVGALSYPEVAQRNTTKI